jgi:hypothetical protein
MLNAILRLYRRIRRGRPEWSYCEKCGHDEFYDGPEGGGFIHYKCTLCGEMTINGNGLRTRECKDGGNPWRCNQ